MKQIHIFLTTILIAGIIFSCEKDNKTIIGGSDTYTSPIITAPESGETYTLSEGAADEIVDSVFWDAVDYGLSIATTYYVIIDRKGGDFSTTTSIGETSGTKFYMVTKDLNNGIFNGLGVAEGESVDIELKLMVVQEVLADTMYSTNSIIFTTAPYSDIPPSWELIGDAFNGWADDDVIIMKEVEAGLWVKGDVTAQEGSFKFRFDGEWQPQYGYGGAYGQLQYRATEDDDDPPVIPLTTAGTYTITLDLRHDPATYKIEL